MGLELIIAAFGGGMLASLWGGLASFVFCGLLAMAGMVCGNADVVGFAFGPLFGPHVAFAGGTAAAAFAGNKLKLLDSGADIATPIAKFGNPAPLLVGGVFGILGALILYLYSTVLGLGNLANFDAIALTVVTQGIIQRFVFGKTGIIGTTGGDRQLMPGGSILTFDLVLGLGLGCIAAYVAIQTQLASLPFALSAFSLAFTACGVPIPGTHHVTNCAAVAGFASGNLFVGIAFGIVAAVLGEIYGSVFNSHCDSHIDPPACTIATLTLVVALLF